MSWLSLVIEQNTSCQLATSFENLVASAQFLVAMATSESQFRTLNIHTPPTEGTGISWGVEGSVWAKILTKCTKFNWSFHSGGRDLRKNPFCGEGMDIFWNYIICDLLLKRCTETWNVFVE